MCFQATHMLRFSSRKARASKLDSMIVGRHAPDNMTDGGTDWNSETRTQRNIRVAKKGINRKT
jgi:hypothetical protein